MLTNLCMGASGQNILLSIFEQTGTETIKSPTKINQIQRFWGSVTSKLRTNLLKYMVFTETYFFCHICLFKKLKNNFTVIHDFYWSLIFYAIYVYSSCTPHIYTHISCEAWLYFYWNSVKILNSWTHAYGFTTRFTSYVTWLHH